jgi:hypothetical protein
MCARRTRKESEVPDGVIAFGPCVVKRPDGGYASVGTIQLLDDGGIEVVIEDPDGDEDTTIAWQAKSVASLLGRRPWPPEAYGEE